MTSSGTDTPAAESPPYSIKALRDYRDGLQELTDAAAHHHEQLLGEAEAHERQLGRERKNFGLVQLFRSWRRRHDAALGKMLASHREIIREVEQTIAKHHKRPQ